MQIVVDIVSGVVIVGLVVECVLQLDDLITCLVRGILVKDKLLYHLLVECGSIGRAVVHAVLLDLGLIWILSML